MREMKSPGPVRGRADPKYEVNQPVARSQTEDCYREIPRDSIWPEIRGGKHGVRVPTVGPVSREPSLGFALTNLSTSLEFLYVPVAALSLAVTFHVQRSPSFPIRFVPVKDKVRDLCALASPAQLRRDKQFSVFLPSVTR